MLVKYQKFVSAALSAIIKQAYTQAFLAIPVDQKWPIPRDLSPLREKLRARVINPLLATLYVPQYWALYVHDGRGAFGPTEKTFLVWFRNPRRDPRLKNGKQPDRFNDIRHLDDKEFYHWLEKNKEAKRDGRPVPMIITRFMPHPLKGTPFFSNETAGGMLGFWRKANDAGNPIVRAGILAAIGKENLHDKDTATWTIGF